MKVYNERKNHGIQKFLMSQESDTTEDVTSKCALLIETDYAQSSR